MTPLTQDSLAPLYELVDASRRPLAFMDLETTGTDTGKDRIVEIALLILYPAAETGRRGDPFQQTRRLNPTIPIPAEATEVHGITDADVADAPTFQRIARSLWELLNGCDVAGFGVRRFDLPLLLAEFKRCGLALDHRSIRIIDLLSLFHLEEPRDLSAAARKYAGRDLEDAHSAEADTLILPEVLAGQLQSYPHLAGGLDVLHARCDEHAPFRTAVERWFGDDLDAPVFQHGKHEGDALLKVLEDDPSYLAWMNREVEEEVRDFIRLFRRRHAGVPA